MASGMTYSDANSVISAPSTPTIGWIERTMKIPSGTDTASDRNTDAVARSCVFSYSLLPRT